MKTTFLKIDKTCAENWDKMKPNKLGTYCYNYAKTLVGFTKLIQFEIQKEHNYSFTNVAAGVLLVTTMIGTSVTSYAQTDKPQVETTQASEEVRENVTSKPNLTKTSNLTVFKGAVISDKDNKPIPNVYITLVTILKTYTTDTLQDGTFSMEIPAEIIDNDNYIKVSYYSIQKENEPDEDHYFENCDYVINEVDFKKDYIITPQIKSKKLLTGIATAFGDGEGAPIYIKNGIEISAKDYNDIINLEGYHNSESFNTRAAIALIGERGKHGLYIIFED